MTHQDAFSQEAADDASAPGVAGDADPLVSIGMAAEDEDEIAVITDFFKPALPRAEEPDDSGDPGDEGPPEEIVPPTLVVSGIVWGTKQPRAIINEEIYGEGDVVEEARIVTINNEGILYEYKGKEFLLKRSEIDQGGGEEAL